ncbi:hypothetical protein POMI540_0375 [Schizosaccharomyces pombe]|uniref:Uncharacterized protein C1F5.05c n=1 Tax=Schizosaccharomyces pombe (strain 972 / ATCC 24843) TaxID=284812 RepID=YAM5_SCHPO|nr:uncharacterized protein SPAC1F5.05c [Schizosaccharomyces pombe]Q10060.1 RecName: Full=Uncharacterized protein C1F5.05c [Schizosaccharomyces pombe 972h-]CAA92233.1 sequence orphan [Schizosaccharomyces pombe]|eukprot:NP_592868.1 uncharacterized protein SPAC1F5.05c [Schizosaccharomyces pombe]
MWSKLSISSKINRIRDPESDNTIEDTHVARVMRKYYMDKIGTLPEWLRPPGWQPPVNTGPTSPVSINASNAAPSNLKASYIPANPRRLSSSTSSASSPPLRRLPSVQHSTFDDLFEGVGSLQKSPSTTKPLSSTPSGSLLRSKFDHTRKKF